MDALRAHPEADLAHPAAVQLAARGDAVGVVGLVAVHLLALLWGVDEGGAGGVDLALIGELHAAAAGVGEVGRVFGRGEGAGVLGLAADAEVLDVDAAGALRLVEEVAPVGLFNYELSPQSTTIRERANEAIRSICERRGVGKFLGLAETPGVYASHPLGGARMADEVGLGVVDDRCEVFNYPGLFCMDSSVIPTSLGVNPSLTISAVCERAAAKLVKHAADYGLPERPEGFRHRVPGVHVGDRIHP